MTAEQIQAMPAGPEMDRIIAGTIFGLKPFRCSEVKAFQNPKHPNHADRDYEEWLVIPSGKPPRTHLIDSRPVPSFSSHIETAWQVVATMRARRLFLTLNDVLGGQWRAAFLETEADFMGQMRSPDPLLFAWEKTPALAICRAALLATTKGEKPCD